MKISLPLTLGAIVALGTGSVNAAETIHIEAETGQLTNTKISREQGGYSGTGYVTNFRNDGDSVAWVIPNATAGHYTLSLRYSTDTNKGFGVIVNGVQTDGMFPNPNSKFATYTLGKVELKAGRNVISIVNGWGWYDLDYIELTPADGGSSKPLPKPPATLVDKKATPQARALMSLLLKNYGQKTLSGQYDDDEPYVRQLTGKTPAIYGADLIEYSPTRVAHGADKTPTAQQLINIARKGQILTLSWHWNAPAHLIEKDYINKDGEKVQGIWWRGFYADATRFDIEKTLANPQSNDYKLLLSDIDAIAVPLKQLNAANVPILWRPLHEADGEWFWWGAKGEKPFKKLWRLMFDRLTNVHGLHNLIWVYTGTAEKPEWYPGNDVVDIFGIDTYPADRNDSLSGTWESLRDQYDGKKMLALTEFKGVPDSAKMRKYGVNWAYFVAWNGDEGTKSQNKAEVKRTYNAPNVINLDSLGQ